MPQGLCPEATVRGRWGERGHPEGPLPPQVLLALHRALLLISGLKRLPPSFSEPTPAAACLSQARAPPPLLIPELGPFPSQSTKERKRLQRALSLGEFIVLCVPFLSSFPTVSGYNRLGPSLGSEPHSSAPRPQPWSPYPLNTPNLWFSKESGKAHVFSLPRI